MEAALPFWSVPPCWPDETVAILGGGASLTQEQVDYCRGRCRVIAINKAFTLAPWADWLFACDPGRFWQWHSGPLQIYRQNALEFAGTKITLWSPDIRVEHAEPLGRLAEDGVRILRHPGDGHHTGLSDDPGFVLGNNGAYQSINAAVHAGATKILLLGVDMGGPRWHEPWPMDQPEYESPAADHRRIHRASIPILGRDVELGWFRTAETTRTCEQKYAAHIAAGCPQPAMEIREYIIPNFATMLLPLAKLGVEVVQCSPGSALKCFPEAKLEDVL